ncbi:hypothetical protein WDX12_29900 [Mesorhizobium sp. RIZ17]
MITKSYRNTQNVRRFSRANTAVHFGSTALSWPGSRMVRESPWAMRRTNGSAARLKSGKRS